MKLHELNATRKKSAKRVGRGISAGQGKTAGRGTKGQNARSGGRVRPGFEGGQTPVYQSLPTLPGFRSIRTKAENIYTGQLDQLAGKTVDNFSMADSGLTSSPYAKVKLIQKGEVTKKVTVKLQSASESAKAAVQKAGGTFEPIPQIKRQPKEKPSKKA